MSRNLMEKFASSNLLRHLATSLRNGDMDIYDVIAMLPKEVLRDISDAVQEDFYHALETLADCYDNQ